MNYNMIQDRMIDSFLTLFQIMIRNSYLTVAMLKFRIGLWFWFFLNQGFNSIQILFILKSLFKFGFWFRLILNLDSDLDSGS